MGQRCHRFVIPATFLLLPVTIVSQGTVARAQQPTTPTRPVVDTLYGTPVPDPYRWLEEDASEEVSDWFWAQGSHARAVLDALPGREALLERIRAIGEAAPPELSLPREAGGRWFYTVRGAGEPVARGYVRDAWTGAERLLIDPDSVDGTGETGANRIATFLPSPDGRLLLYGIETGGSVSVVLRVRDAVTGLDLGPPLSGNSWPESAWWLPGGRSFLYVRLPDRPDDAAPTDRYRDIRLFRHRIGEDPVSDEPVFSAGAVGEDDRLITSFHADLASGAAFGVLNSGVELHASAFFHAPLDALDQDSPSWQPLFARSDSVTDLAVRGGDLYALTRRGAPRGRVVRTRLEAPDLDRAEPVMPEGEQSLEAMAVALDGLYVRGYAEGAHQVTRIPWGGAPARVLIPPGTSVGQLRADPLRSGALLALDSWTSVGRQYRYQPSTDSLRELPFREVGPYDRLEGVTAEILYAPGHDGVRIPLTLVRPAGPVGDGDLPVILQAYGAYGITDAPVYRAELLPWMESGGASATCHVRGGGYYGEGWHQAGLKATKPNSWLDLIACADFLVDAGHTRPERLVAFGGSAGGITVGRAITERPDLFAGVIIVAGVLDLVRAETTPSGPPNIPEFGSVATEDGFRALLAMSAVHHVEPGTSYPAVLLTTGLNDPAVAPWQPGKMAAALQASTTSGRPVLLRVDEALGHSIGGGTYDQLQQTIADILAFAMAETGMPPYRPRSQGASR